MDTAGQATQADLALLDVAVEVAVVVAEAEEERMDTLAIMATTAPMGRLAVILLIQETQETLVGVEAEVVVGEAEEAAVARDA